MNDAATFLLMAVAIGVGLLFTYAQTETHKQRICEYLHSRGATAIEVSTHWIGFRWLDNDKGTSTYTVTYRDRQGRRHRTSCKIRSSLFGDQSIYWKDPI